MSDIVSFGEWVQARRNQFHLSRAALAREVGCSPVTIKKIERDERRPSFQIAELLAQHLKIPEADQDNFMRRARGEFVARFGSPTEMSLAEAQAPASEADTPKHNLPPQTTPFIGRQTELANIVTQLADPTCRLLTILGAGGMGKTRLGIEVAQAQVGNFTDGIIYVSLAPIAVATSPDAINPLAAALADALQISFHGRATPEQQLFDYLRRKEMLLVFDNFEHLVNSAVFLSSLLTQAPDIKILTTSRERLNLQNEWLFVLQGLSYSNDETAAIQLFAQRARQVKANFDLAREETAVLRICQLVEGMPLGLELAASWVIQLSCSEIADEIESELDFLTSEMRDVPDRQQSIRAIFSYSWEKLSDKEQDVLRKLSVFRGGFERKAAKAVAGASLAVLAKLVGKSLLSVGENGAFGKLSTPRYHIHELLRQFAAEKLDIAVEAEAETRHNHSGYYLNFLHEQEASLIGAEARTALAAIKVDIDNVREAWRWGVIHQSQQLSLEAIHSLFTFYETQGWYLEAKNRFEQAALLYKPRCLPAHKGSSQHSQNCLKVGLLQTVQAFACLRLGNFDIAEDIFRDSLHLLEAIGQKGHWIGVMCQTMLGTTLHYSNQLTLGNSYLQAAMNKQQKIDNQFIRAFVFAVFGQLRLALGQYDEAEQLAHDSKHILASLNNQLLQPFNFSTLGRTAMARGFYEAAEGYHQEALKMRANTDTWAGIVFTWSDLADVAMLQGRYDQAQHYLHQVLAFEHENNMWRGIDATNIRLGQLAAAEGNYELAKQYIAKTEGRAISQLWTESGTGWIYLEMKELDTAKQIFLGDLQTMQAANRPPPALDAIAGLAHLKALDGFLQHALELIMLVLNHPAATQLSKDRVLALKEELELELPDGTVAAAGARGRGIDLWETAVSLLIESD
ncbi:MAG: tetratricopeptide repeat protein [Chloroflexota bacterium]